MFARLVLAALMTTLLLSGCASARSDAEIMGRLPVDQNWTTDDYKYRLGPGDELGLRLVLNPDLNSQVTIGPDGRGVFPLIAGIKLAGLTVEEANAVLTKAYAPYLRKPAAELLIYNYLGGQIYVSGEVKLPGARTIRGPTSITQAIADMGGFLDTARTDKVVLLRRKDGAHVLMKVVNVDAILSHKSGEDVLLLPGDVVFVPRSSIAEVNRIVRQYITNVIPFNMDYQVNQNGHLTQFIH